MKKAAAILMGLSLLIAIPVGAQVAEESLTAPSQQSTIRTTVPDAHMISVQAEHAQVVYQDEEGEDDEQNCTYAVRRFSSPQFSIHPQEGWKISSILLNGVDVTSQLKDGLLTIPEIYEDQLLVVYTEEKTTDSQNPVPTQNPGDSGKKQPSGDSGKKQTSTSGTGQPQQKDTAGATDAAAVARTADMQMQVIYFMLAVVAGAMLLLLLDGRKKNGR